MRQCLGEGVAPVFFVTLPDAADPKTDQALARWIDEIQRRQSFDLRPWHDAGELAPRQTDWNGLENSAVQRSSSRYCANRDVAVHSAHAL